MSQSAAPQFETDPRFPSGPWVGFYLMPHTRGKRHPTELKLTFADGTMTGSGRDVVGPFTIQGRYEVVEGKCRWVKHYHGKHDVYYSGFNEGKGIWGTWDIPNALGVVWNGGFHIWPAGMGDPTQQVLHAEADPPAVVEEAGELEPAGVV